MMFTGHETKMFRLWFTVSTWE